jgi:hypothetical protein
MNKTLTDELIIHAFDLSGVDFPRDQANVNRLIAAVRGILATQQPEPRASSILDAVERALHAAGEEISQAAWRSIEAALAEQPEPRAEVKPRKVYRHSDMSVLVVFCSAREASVFEKEIRARAGDAS